jgi:flagellar biosynthetic protein FliR
MTVTLFSLHDFLLFVFVTVRIGAIVFALPFLGSRNLPAPLKILFIFLLSYGLYPAVQQQGIVIPLTLPHLTLFIVGELLIGLTIGFVVQTLFAGIRMGGEFVSQQMGLSMASLFDPQNGVQNSVIAQFYYTLAVVLFFTMQTHHWFIYAMAESLHRVPLLGFLMSKTVVSGVILRIENLFIMAIKIGAPVISVLLMTTLALGILTRMVPQMNLFALSFPVSLTVGFVMIGFALPYVMQQVQTLLHQLGRELFFMIRLLGAG